jgi:hypothetical protein
MAFEGSGAVISLAAIDLLRPVTPAVRKSVKYAQIAASIREVGIIEPPVVARKKGSIGRYLLLDGHIRLDILSTIGAVEVACLISTDDEAFTYNKRVNRLATIQEHRMILKAIERGVPDDRIARALNVNVSTLREKKNLLNNICPEAVDLLADKHVPLGSFAMLRKMAPTRQIEAAELMISMNKYTINYSRSLLIATPPDQLLEGPKQRIVKGLSDQQLALMERESSALERAFKVAEQSYGEDRLALVITKGYLSRLLGNSRVARYLTQNHADISTEFQKLTEPESSAA